MNTNRLSVRAICGLSAAVLSAAGCASQPNVALMTAVYEGEHGRARALAQRNLSSDPDDRSYMLDRMRLALVLLADGLTTENDPVIDAVFDKLRQQGINDSKMVAAAVLNESVKFWKGEPFEQAMMFCYIGAHYAAWGIWDNCRAAVGNSLFQLRSFGTNEKGEPLDGEAIARKAAAYDVQNKVKEGDEGYLEKGYTPVKSNFTPGYLLNAVANQIIGRRDEADDNYNEAVKIDGRLKGLVDEFKAGGFNVVLLVDFGPGPAKIAYGEDNALVKFQPRVPGGDEPLLVSVDGGSARLYPWIVDLNRLASHHMWNNLQDVRRFKSVAGKVLQAAAAPTAHAIGGWQGAVVGAGMFLVGTVARAGAAGDTRHCEILPQRQYLLPLRVDGPQTRVALEVQGKPYSRMVLTNIQAPAPGKPPILRYVRLISPLPSGKPAAPPPWATTGELLYFNEYGGPVNGRNFPWVLGGDCVRAPTQEVLNSYRRAGYCKDLELQDLAAIYKEEKIVLPDEQGETEKRGLHILEGGNSLATPMPGTAGYMRLFCKRHPPYSPKSDLCRDWAARVGGPSAPSAAGTR